MYVWMPRRRRAVGAHVFVSGGLHRALARALERECDALQIFPSNPRGWARPEPDRAEEDRLRAACAERGFPLFVHAPYLVNLASSDARVAAMSLDNVVFALERAGRLGASALVVHAGQGVDSARPAAVDRLVEQLGVALDVAADAGVDLALELTASGRCPLARTIEEVHEIVHRLDGHPRLRVCLDTCHLWAAGCDFTTVGGARAMAAALRALGSARVAVVHVNDSHDPLGSRRDHHANLGAGTIPLDGLRRFLRIRELHGVPMIVETPGTVEEQARDVALVRAFAG